MPCLEVFKVILICDLSLYTYIALLKVQQNTANYNIWCRRHNQFCGINVGKLTLIFLSLFLSQLRFRVAWWVQGTSAVGRFNVSTTTRVKSKGCTISVSLCCTTPAVTTHRWGAAWKCDPFSDTQNDYLFAISPLLHFFFTRSAWESYGGLMCLQYEQAQWLMVCICEWLFTGQSNRNRGAETHPRPDLRLWLLSRSHQKLIPPVALLLPGQVICEGCIEVHGAGTAAALQLRQPTVLGSKRDGVLAPERVLLQTPALPDATGPHGHHGQLDPVPSDFSPGVRETHINK